jgi:hypothetical protein
MKSIAGGKALTFLPHDPSPGSWNIPHPGFAR